MSASTGFRQCKAVEESMEKAIESVLTMMEENKLDVNEIEAPLLAASQKAFKEMKKIEIQDELNDSIATAVESEDQQKQHNDADEWAVEWAVTAEQPDWGVTDGSDFTAIPTESEEQEAEQQNQYNDADEWAVTGPDWGVSEDEVVEETEQDAVDELNNSTSTAIEQNPQELAAERIDIDEEQCEKKECAGNFSTDELEITVEQREEKKINHASDVNEMAVEESDDSWDEVKEENSADEEFFSDEEEDEWALTAEKINWEAETKERNSFAGVWQEVEEAFNRPVSCPLIDMPLCAASAKLPASVKTAIEPSEDEEESYESSDDEDESFTGEESEFIEESESEPPGLEGLEDEEDKTGETKEQEEEKTESANDRWINQLENLNNMDAGDQTRTLEAMINEMKKAWF